MALLLVIMTTMKMKMTMVIISNMMNCRYDYKLFLNKEEQDALRRRYLNGSIGYKESKEMLSLEIIKFILNVKWN